jgi:hypothetical protein
MSKICRAGFLSGDFGKSKIWRDMGAVIGVFAGKPFLRSGG